MNPFRAWLITKGQWIDLGPATKWEYTAAVASPVVLRVTWKWHADRTVIASIMAIDLVSGVSFVSLNHAVTVATGDTLSITRDFPTAI